VDTLINEAIELLDSLKCLSKSFWLPEGLKGILGRRYKERLRSNLFQLASDQYVSDLTAILHIYPYENNLANRLLLVIDDFEILGKTMAEYIVTGLIPLSKRQSLKALFSLLDVMIFITLILSFNITLRITLKTVFALKNLQMKWLWPCFGSWIQ